MKIVALEPYLTDLIVAFGGGSRLIGVGSRCRIAPDAAHPAVITSKPAAPSTKAPVGDDERLAAGLTTDRLNLQALVELKPDVVMTRCTEQDTESFVSWAQAELEKRVGKRVLVESFAPDTMSALYQMYEDVAECLGDSRRGQELAQRTKAQIQDWTRSFYERARNKKVTVLASVEPLMLATGLMSDLVRGVTGQPQQRAEGRENTPFTWEEVVEFRSDVIIVAPCGASLQESIAALKKLEALDGWESVPAVKRGEVVFCAGTSLYLPGPEFLRSAAIVVSAMAGLDSGYITLKDEYFRLRFIELHRHRFV